MNDENKTTEETDCQFPNVKPISGYRNGCRCDRCKAGNREARRRQRSGDKRKAYNAYMRQYNARKRDKAE